VEIIGEYVGKTACENAVEWMRDRSSSRHGNLLAFHGFPLDKRGADDG
jgi:hypothetical protein